MEDVRLVPVDSSDVLNWEEFHSMSAAISAASFFRAIVEVEGFYCGSNRFDGMGDKEEQDVMVIYHDQSGTRGGHPRSACLRPISR